MVGLKELVLVSGGPKIPEMVWTSCLEQNLATVAVENCMVKGGEAVEAKEAVY